MKNKEKFSVAYAGTNPLVKEIMDQRFPENSLMQYSNKEDFESAMMQRASTFDLLIYGGQSNVDVERVFSPNLIISDPDLPLKDNPSETSPCGPGMIKAISRGLAVSKAYVLVNDEAYDSDLKGIKSCCETHKIDVLRTSELERKLEELLKD